MRLLVLSDLHLEVAPLDLPDPGPFDVAVLAGDIAHPGTRVPAWVQASPVLQRARAVLWVPGNHEYYDAEIGAQHAAMRAAAAAVRTPALHLLDGTAAVVVDGVRFVGCTLWTDFALRIDSPDGPRADRARAVDVARRSMVDYRAIQRLGGDGVRRRLQPEDTLALHAEQSAWLLQQLQQPFAGPTVVVTHHGPHRGSLAPRYAADWISAAYLSELPAAFFDVAALWIHGHTHTSQDHRVGRCRVLCNPRGWQPKGWPRPENPLFDPALVVELACDATGTGPGAQVSSPRGPAAAS